MTPVEVKTDESAAMDGLEAALDLAARPEVIEATSSRSLASVAGAADVAILLWDRGDGGRHLPPWARAGGVRRPLRDWLRSDARRRPSSYVRVVDIPSSTAESRTPGSPFVIFQDEAAMRLHRAGMASSTARRLLGAFT